MKTKVNKSELVREALRNNPNATGQEIVGILKKQKITVQPTTVYTIRQKMAEKKRVIKRFEPDYRKHLGISSENGNGDQRYTLDEIAAAKQLVNDCERKGLFN